MTRHPATTATTTVLPPSCRASAAENDPLRANVSSQRFRVVSVPSLAFNDALRGRSRSLANTLRPAFTGDVPHATTFAPPTSRPSPSTGLSANVTPSSPAPMGIQVKAGRERARVRWPNTALQRTGTRPPLALRAGRASRQPLNAPRSAIRKSGFGAVTRPTGSSLSLLNVTSTAGTIAALHRLSSASLQ